MRRNYGSIIAFALILLIGCGCGTLKIQGQILAPDEATSTRIVANLHGSATPATSPNLSPATFPTPQTCQVDFFWGAMPGLCPNQMSAQVDAAFQVYDDGYMLWEGATGSVYVLYNGGSGRRVEVSIIAGWPEIQVSTPAPANHVYPVRGFGRVWQHEADIRTGLGWPLGLEQAYTAQFQSAGVTTSDQYFYISIPNGQVVEFNRAGSWRVVK